MIPAGASNRPGCFSISKSASTSASACPVFEPLEPRMLLSASPSPFEQEMLWLINDMRTEPADHLDHFISGYGTPASSSDGEIQESLAYFNVAGSVLQSDWTALAAAAPLAWSPQLDDAAEFHSLNMIAEDAQEHAFPPGPGLGQRITDSGYDWTRASENIFAYAESALHGHAGFVVDWGYGTGGMQNPPGHRNAIMNPLWVHVGVAAIAESDDDADVGPYVVTQDFAKPWPDDDPYLVGTIWSDANADGKFDGGEGFGAVSVTAVGPVTRSTTSWNSGGYQLQLPSGAYDVSFSGGAFAGEYSTQITISDENVKLDAIPQSSQVVARRLFYNNSARDGNDPAANTADDAAIAAYKAPLLPGGTVGSEHQSNYSRGINGLMVDIDELPGDVTAADFDFEVNSSLNPNIWTAAPEPMDVKVREDAGVNGSDRITIIWADGAVRNQWIKVTVKANAHTDLENEDVFYFGNLVGDCDGDGTVGDGDYDIMVSEFGRRGGAVRADIDADGTIGLTDFAILRGSFGGTLSAPTIPGDPAGQTVRFAVIGDYGSGSADEADVARLVESMDPDFVVTTGDNRYGEATFDEVVGRYYGSFLTGPANAFFPSPGNHEYLDGGGIDEYLDYFTLPGAGVESTDTSGSERYYDFVQGPVHFFVLDSQKAIFDAADMTAQQDWLEAQLAASTAPWQIVYMHHPPYSSSMHGSSGEIQWPYADWGADFVISGHDHVYERIEADGIAYFINGLGGSSRYTFGSPVSGSEVRYGDNFGAMLVDASPEDVNFRFIDRNGLLIDDYVYRE